MSGRNTAEYRIITGRNTAGYRIITGRNTAEYKIEKLAESKSVSISTEMLLGETAQWHTGETGRQAPSVNVKLRVRLSSPPGADYTLTFLWACRKTAEILYSRSRRPKTGVEV
jgi:hypothetical protein